MDTARKGMGIKQMTKKEKLKEFIQRARPMLKEATVEKKLEVLQFIKESIQDIEEAGSPAQQAAIAINMKKNHKKPKHIDESEAVKITDYDTWSDAVKELGGEIYPQKDRNVLIAQSWDGQEIGKFHLGKSMGFINKQGVVEGHDSEEPFDLENRHTMDYGMRKFMVHKLAKTTGYGVSDLELASDEELRDLFQQTFPDKQLDEDYLDEK
jgi:hypothetical protein